MHVCKLRLGRNLALQRFLAATLVLAWAPVARSSSQKQALEAKYKHKFAEVLQEGLVVGNCSDTNPFYVVAVGIDDSGIERRIANKLGCATQPLHKGEILSIEKVLTADHGRNILLNAATVSPHWRCPP
jgi:hypothetical protein